MAYVAIHKHCCTNAHERYSQKLRRWRLDDPSHRLHNHLSVIQRTPSWHARSAHQRLKAFARITTPRVHTAVHGAGWNRLCTLRRFQLRGICRLCHQHNTEDSIEHYGFCSCVQALAARHLKLDTAIHVNIRTFTCTNPRLKTRELLTKAALLIYATYRALNRQRHVANSLRPEEFLNAMSQWVIECRTRPCNNLPDLGVYSDGAERRSTSFSHVVAAVVTMTTSHNHFSNTPSHYVNTDLLIQLTIPNSSFGFGQF